MLAPRNFAPLRARIEQQRGGIEPAAELGVYVHFPWCLKKCPYCDFTSFATPREDVPHAAYADAVLAELESRSGDLDRLGSRVATVFFGGGTPSLWEPQAIGRVLGAVLDRPTTEDVEITVECNPSSLDAERARALRDVGVTRLSVGVQSLDAERLGFLGRLHDAPGGLRAVEAALSTGLRVSADVIFGVAGGRPQSPEDAAREALRVAGTGVTHVSAYGLTIEEGTVFGERHRRGDLPIAGDDRMAESFLAVEEALGGAGFAHYEVSNYATAGHEARHNMGYWRGADYLGLGCAAVGTLATGGGHARRYKNLRDPTKYARRAQAGEATESETEDLDPETRLRERIMLGLRLSEGLDLEQAGRSLGLAALTDARRRAIARLVEHGRLEAEGARVRVPHRARLFTDAVAAALM